MFMYAWYKSDYKENRTHEFEYSIRLSFFITKYWVFGAMYYIC